MMHQTLEHVQSAFQKKILGVIQLEKPTFAEFQEFDQHKMHQVSI